MTRKDIMLCYPYDENRIIKWRRPWLVQPKFDGVRCRALVNDNVVQLLSSQGNSLNFALPHIVSELRNYPDGEYDGEIYCHELSFQEIVGIAKRTQELHPDYRLVDFWMFDLVIDQPQLARIQLLEKLWLETANAETAYHVFACETRQCSKLEQLHEWLDIFLSQGFEGMIVRKCDALYKRARSTNILKIKPTKSDEYKIVGFTEELSIHGEPKDRLGAFMVADQDGRRFNVGTGLTEAQRYDYWGQRSVLLGKTLKVKYQNLTDGGIPRFPVFLGVYDDTARTAGTSRQTDTSA